MKVEGVIAKQVIKRFGSILALRGVDAHFRGGEVSLVLGANGSGKSTLLGILGTTLSPTAGELVFEPDPGSIAEVRGQIGWLSHDTLSYGDLSGQQNVEMAAEFHGMDPNAAWERARDRFQLGSYCTRPVRTYSRGQRQRIALARALVHEPSVVLLDEPTTGLDSEGVERLLSVLRECVETGAVIVVVTHDASLFDLFKPVVHRMNRGRLET